MAKTDISGWVSKGASKDGARTGFGAIVVGMEGTPFAGEREDQEPYVVSHLLEDEESNSKLALSAEVGDWLTYGLPLAPSTQNGLGANLCEFASKVCKTICLHATGQARILGGMARIIHRARVAKSRLWVLDKLAFRSILMRDVATAERRAKRQGKRLAVRLNVLSDIPWETEFPELFRAFPEVQFYDYTKRHNRVGKTPANYHLTFSRSESNERVATEHLRNGHNTAVVFENHDFPATWNGYQVVDGTKHDLRFLDPKGVVVALAEKDTEMHGPKYQGKRNTRVNTRGFVLPTVTSSNPHRQTLVVA